MKYISLIYLTLLVITLSAFTAACGTAGHAQTTSPVNDPTPTPTPTYLLFISSPEPAQTTALPSAVTQTRTPHPTATKTPTRTPTRLTMPTITPTYATLRGRVLQLSNCRYGPAAVYLYKYALIAGSNLEVIGRDPAGKWILVQAIGGNNPCWVNARLMDVEGDIMSLAPLDPDVILPRSPYYGPTTWVSATRSGAEVTVFWAPVNLRAGDDSEQTPYLIEAWVCRGEQIVFTVVGSYTTAATVDDEPGCSEPSSGRIYAAEKHGYTRGVEIPWPAATFEPHR